MRFALVPRSRAVVLITLRRSKLSGVLRQGSNFSSVHHKAWGTASHLGYERPMMKTGTIGPFRITASNQPRLELGVLIIPAWPIPLTVLCTFVFLSINGQYRDNVLATTRRLLPWLLTGMRLLNLCRIGYDTTATLRRNGFWMDVITLEFLVTVLEYDFVQQRDLTTCILLALGWLALWKPMPVDADYTTERMVAVHISAALFFGVVPLERRHITLAISGASLLMIALTSPAAIHYGPPWSALTLGGALFVRISARGQLLLGLDPQFRGKTTFHEFRRAVSGLLALINIVFGGILVSGWIWSCYVDRYAGEVLHSKGRCCYSCTSIKCTTDGLQSVSTLYCRWLEGGWLLLPKPWPGQHSDTGFCMRSCMPCVIALFDLINFRQNGHRVGQIND